MIMSNKSQKSIKFLVVDTTAFIQNEPLLHLAENIVSVADVLSEIKYNRQLRRLCVLPYELVIKDVFPENIKVVTDFSKKTGDYPSLSATDIKVMALTYQLEKELVGIEHLRTNPIVSETINKVNSLDLQSDFIGFYNPDKSREKYAINDSKPHLVKEVDTDISEDVLKHVDIYKLQEKFGSECKAAGENKNEDESNSDSGDILVSVKHEVEQDNSENDIGWITPANVKAAKNQVNSIFAEDKPVQVACLTTDFAMQNMLKQMNLNISTLDGRIIKQLRTYILRCYTCFKTTSIMTTTFCLKCGNNTMKKVSISTDANGKQVIHINNRRPLTARGKKFSMPTIKGGKHSRNPILVVDQPMPEQRPTRIARTKTNALDDNYIAGYSPFATRDVNSKSAQLKIRSSGNREEVKHWMKKNPNEAIRRRK